VTPYGIDPLLLGQRIRHLRKEAGLTLDEMAKRVGKPAPYLSQLENGKREPKLSLVASLAEALSTTTAELVRAEAPSRRSQLEIQLERSQEDALYQSLRLPYLKPTATLPDAALEHLGALYRSLESRLEVQAASPEGARLANAALRHKMRERNNYFADIEQLATSVLHAVGWDSTSAIPERTLFDISAHLGFSIRRVPNLPPHTRSITDQRNRVIFIPQRNRMDARNVRSVVLQTLGHFALNQPDPTSLSQHLQQRVEANYFAAAVLAPEASVVPFLRDAKARHDLCIADIAEAFYISYEMAAHRFTNLATRHLDLPVHFLRADSEGLIGKAYENDGLPFPTDSGGAIEGQWACRAWGARIAQRATDMFETHYQYTDTPDGAFWDATYVEANDQPRHAISIGVTERNARWFRGSDTKIRHTSTCPASSCCRQPAGDLAKRWQGMTWPLSNQPSYLLPGHTVGSYPGVDLIDVYEFLDAHSPDDGPM
jgi:XRE family transcriptional regulator, fatty acid utilization regulator